MKTIFDQLAKSQFIDTLVFIYNDTGHNIQVFHNLENQDSYLSQELPELFQYNMDILSPEVKKNYIPVLYNLIEDPESLTHTIIFKLVHSKLPKKYDIASLAKEISKAFWDDDAYPNPPTVSYTDDLITVQVIGYY